jgi:putative tryptophan/tyrosine transport system substrate-binding protein
MVDMRRREFVALLGGAATAWPLAAGAQQPTMPVIGFLNAGSPEQSARLVAAYRKGLSETGYVEGQNVAIEFRWAAGQDERLAEMAADLIRRRVAVIATPGNTPATLAAKAATTTIPIVFAADGDPVEAGLVASLNRPGGNLTGITTMSAELSAKRLGLLHELMPGAARFAVLVNPNGPYTGSMVTELRGAAEAIGRQLDVLAASTDRDIVPVFARLDEKRADALLISPDPLFINRLVQLATLAARHAVPAIFSLREFAEVGGLMSYGASFTDLFRQAGIYTGKILKGERPADLPVLRATKFEFVINSQTAEALGIEVPPTLLARADEVSSDGPRSRGRAEESVLTGGEMLPLLSNHSPTIRVEFRRLPAAAFPLFPAGRARPGIPESRYRRRSSRPCRSRRIARPAYWQTAGRGMQ